MHEAGSAHLYRVYERDRGYQRDLGHYECSALSAAWGNDSTIAHERERQQVEGKQQRDKVENSAMYSYGGKVRHEPDQHSIRDGDDQHSKKQTAALEDGG